MWSLNFFKSVTDAKLEPREVTFLTWRLMSHTGVAITKRLSKSLKADKPARGLSFSGLPFPFHKLGTLLIWAHSAKERLRELEDSYRVMSKLHWNRLESVPRSESETAAKKLFFLKSHLKRWSFERSFDTLKKHPCLCKFLTVFLSELFLKNS